MESAEMLTLALQVATAAHAGQVDKAGMPYILHPMRVAAAMAPDDILGAVVALLHDVAEDADPALLDPFPPIVHAAVLALTRRKDETYEAFIERLAPNALARRVKLADLADNLREDRQPKLLTEQDIARRVRYIAAKTRLKG